MKSDPIVSLASGSCQGAIALFRFSGKGCHELIKPMLSLASKPSTILSARLYRGYLYDLLSSLPGDQTFEILDEPLVAYFFAPYSYTGEDMVEVSVHGGSYIKRRLLEVSFHLGFRQADPGEFTLRAYWHQKLDLTKAEGIHALVVAQSEQQWMAARYLAKGTYREALDRLRQDLVRCLALFAARIDFPDEDDTHSVVIDEITDLVRKVELRLQKQKANSRQGQISLEGLRVTLIGQPNVGKSSLLNALLEKKRAIVSDQAGTTRDYLEESCLIKGRLVRVCDTAGLRDTTDDIEHQGITATYDMISTSDLVLLLIACPALDSANANSLSLFYESIASQKASFKHRYPNASFLVVLTKSDLWDQTDMSFQNQDILEACLVSTKKESGLDDLRQLLIKAVDQNLPDWKREDAVAVTPRHLNHIDQALEAISRFFKDLENGSFDDMLSFNLQEASSSLDALIGKVEVDEVLGEVFSTFCIGK